MPVQLARPRRFAPVCAASAALVAVAAAATAPAHAQVPSHIYELNGSLTDSLGGPSLTNNGATLGPTGLTFAPNQGPSLLGGVAAANYSVELYFFFDATEGYRKILDFKNLASDNGLYNRSTTLNFYNFAEGPVGAFANGTLAHVVLTRDGGTNDVVGYVNGVQQIAFNDAGGDGIFALSGPDTIAQFLQDDNATGQGEASGGFLDFIRIYDNPLTQAEVTARYNATISGGAAAPEPGTLALLGAGVLLGGAGVIRRRKNAA